MIIKSGTFSCDAGSLKVGNKGFSVLIKNGYGDGEFEWSITTEEPEDMNFECCIQGEGLYIYDKDGSFGEPVYGPFSGSFIAFSKKGKVCLYRLSEKPDWWGLNGTPDEENEKMVHNREDEINLMELSGCARDTKTIEIPVHLWDEVYKYMKHVKAVADNDKTFRSAVYSMPLEMILGDMDKISRFYE